MLSFVLSCEPPNTSINYDSNTNKNREANHDSFIFPVHLHLCSPSFPLKGILAKTVNPLGAAQNGRYSTDICSCNAAHFFPPRNHNIVCTISQVTQGSVMRTHSVQYAFKHLVFFAPASEGFPTSSGFCFISKCSMILPWFQTFAQEHRLLRFVNILVFLFYICKNSTFSIPC